MDTVVSLLNQVANDEIVLPAIQRDFVWPQEKVTELMDSILRGYPVGLILLWETYEDIQYRGFVKDYRGDVPHAFRENGERRRLKLVLDGQQRLQSLYVALYGTFERKQLWFDLLTGFESDDLAEQRFGLQFMTSAEARELNSQEPGDGDLPYLFIQTAKLFSMSTKDQRELRKRTAAKWKLAEQDVDLIDESLGRFHDGLSRSSNVIKVASIDENLAPADPSRLTESDVTEVFVRVNVQGTKLSRSDLIFSLLKLNWKESAEALPEFVRSINAGNNLDITTDFVIRCLFAVSNLGTRMDLELLRKKSNVKLLRDNFDECCEGIRAAVDFAVRHCKCENAALLGGLDTLVPVVYYLFYLPKHDVPNGEITKLKSSVYMLAFSKAFSRYGEGRMGNFIRKELQPLAASASTAFPYEKVVGRVAFWEKSDTFDLSFAAGNVQLALHLVQGLSGGRVQYADNAPEVDHIFPKATLRKKGFSELEINTVANYWILARGKNRNKSDQHPAKYFADVDDVLLSEGLIDRELLDFRRYRTFLQSRGDAMLGRLKARMDWPE